MDALSSRPSGERLGATIWSRYSDYENRLPRGRTYVRNGSVVDLQIAASQVTALVSGSEIYEVKVKILPVAKPRWKSICDDCAGSIDSLVELLQGRLSKGVMERISQQQTGLFPSPKEIKLSCSCPDWAEMCKHVAAVLYGVGTRLDQQPELLFRLRAVNEKELIASAGKALPSAKKSPVAAKVLGEEDLSKLFGLELADSESASQIKTARAKSATDTSSKPVASRTKPSQKALNSTVTPRSVAQTKTTARKKPNAAPAKTKSDQASALKIAAAKPTTKRAISAQKRAVATTKRKIAVVAAKEKPTQKTATKKSSAKGSSQTKTIAIRRRGYGRSPAKS